MEGLLNPLAMTDDDWRALITQMGEPRDWQAHIEGLSRFTADELEAVYRAGGVGRRCGRGRDGCARARGSPC
jgi:hypothetical protein